MINYPTLNSTKIVSQHFQDKQLRNQNRPAPPLHMHTFCLKISYSHDSCLDFINFYSNTIFGKPSIF